MLTQERSSTPCLRTRLDGRRLDAAPLQVELEPDAGQPVGAERQRLVERREIGRDASQAFEIAAAHAAARGAVAHLAQVVRVREDERPVGEVEDVELQHVAAELHRELERRERVLGRERGGAAVADAREPAFAAGAAGSSGRV